MPHVEKPLTGTGVLVDFARDLRSLRERAGLSYRDLVRMTPCNYAALYSAASGVRLPQLETLESFVTACKGDREAWRQRWHTLDKAKRSGTVLRTAWPPALHDFLARLHDLRKSAGAAGDYRKIAEAYGCSRTYVHSHIRVDAARLPRRDLVECVVRACGGDVVWWYGYWQQTADACSEAAEPPASE